MARKKKSDKPQLAFISLRHPDYSPAILNAHKIKEITETTKGETEIEYDSKVTPTVKVREPKAIIEQKIIEAKAKEMELIGE